MEKNIIKALYQIRKNQIIQFYRLDAEKSQISEALAYALSRDCYPYFHSDDEFDIYDDCFVVKKDFFEKVIKFIDDDWIKNVFHTFYELEDVFGHDNRAELIAILRYCFLDNRFGGDGFWEKIVSRSPCEANGINRPLDSWEI